MYGQTHRVVSAEGLGTLKTGVFTVVSDPAGAGVGTDIGEPSLLTIAGGGTPCTPLRRSITRERVSGDENAAKNASGELLKESLTTAGRAANRAFASLIMRCDSSKSGTVVQSINSGVDGVPVLGVSGL